MRQLLTLVIALGIVLASLRVGGMLASTVQIAGVVLFLALAINALVGHGETRVFAIGFLTTSSLYILLFIFSGAELDPYDRALPTSSVLRAMHEQLVVRTYTDMQGNAVTDYDPAKHTVVSSVIGGQGMPGGGVFGAGGYPANAVTMYEKVDRKSFMLIGHGAIALLLAWLGGKYAVFISHRKQ